MFSRSVRSDHVFERRFDWEGMMTEPRLRGDNWSDPLRETLTEDPAIRAVIEETQHESMQADVTKAIQTCDDRKLAAWVAVAVWEDDDGNISHSVVGDDHSTFLELKGYLHSGIWAAAHAE